MPSYKLLVSAMKTRELELKTLKTKTGSRLYAKGKKQGKSGSRNTDKQGNGDQKDGGDTDLKVFLLRKSRTLEKEWLESKK